MPLRRGDHFVNGGKVWRAECDSFPTSGAVGEIVQAWRLEWDPPYDVGTRTGRLTVPAGARPYGAKEMTSGSSTGPSFDVEGAMDEADVMARFDAVCWFL